MFANASRRPSGCPRGERPAATIVRRQERIAAADHAHGLALQRNAKVARLAMRPVEHPFFAVDGKPDVVLPARRRLGHREGAAHAALEFDHRRRVVDDLAARQQRHRVGAEALGAKAGDEAREVLGVAADRAHHQRLPAPLGIENPAQPVRLRPLLQARREAALDVLDPHEPEIAQRAIAHQRLRMARHRIGGVGMRDGEQAPLLPRPRDEVAGFAEIVRDRLVADDVEARVERGLRDRIVGVVRRHDRDAVDGVVAPGLALQHLGQVAVTAGGIESHGGAVRARARRIAGEHAGHGLPGTVELRGGAMHLADPGLGTAADDAQAQSAPETLPQSTHAASRIRDPASLADDVVMPE